MSEIAITLRLTRSPRLTAVLAVAHAGAAACVLASDLPPLAEVGLALGLVFLGWQRIRYHGTRRSARSIRLLVWDRQGQWRMIRRNGRVVDAVLLPGGFVHPQLVVLTFRTRAGARIALTIVPDMARGEDLRRLRVRLRCTGSGEPTKSVC